MSRRTKIVGTIGPSSWDETVLRRLIEEGLDVVRLNFSHAEHNQAATTIKLVRKLSHETGRNVAILQDLQGPRIRLGELPVPITLVSGHEIVLTTRSADATIANPTEKQDQALQQLRERLRAQLTTELQSKQVSLSDEKAVADYIQQIFDKSLTAEPISLSQAEKVLLQEAVFTEIVNDRSLLTNQSPHVPIDYRELPLDVKPGDTILIADGLIELKVIASTSDDIRCIVISGGKISSHKGINVPSVTLRVPTITDKDKEDLKFGVEHGVDYVALSFVRRAEDMVQLKQLIREYGEASKQSALPLVICKIEKHEAIDNFDAILEETDGVMVARGDLGVELPAEQVPVLQKMLIHKCNLAGKTVITATQMLESMIQNPRPTRAEAADVANAILDGTDATMLSGETAIGLYPIQAVQVMGRIAQTIETELFYKRPPFDMLLETASSVTDAISQAACGIGRELNAVAIIAPTTSGTTPRMVARNRSPIPLYAFTHEEPTYHRMALIWGVDAIMTERFTTTDELAKQAEKELISRGLAKAGDILVITIGVPIGVPGRTNAIRVHVVGEA